MRRAGAVIVFLILGFTAGCASRGPARVPMEPEQFRPKGWTEKGDASWYGHPYHGRKTASGETYNMYDLTAAHRSLPFGTRLLVTRRDNGQKVVVRVNDRGPFIKGRIIDLSYGAAKKIHLDVDGVAPVKIRVLDEGEPRNPAPAPTPPRKIPETRGENRECYWVQVGAFSSPENAGRALKRLKDAGEKALIIEGPEGLQRVRSGPWDSQNDALDALHRLHEDWPKARLVECGGS